MRLRTVAEGVEHESQSGNCANRADLLQGYYFGKAAPASSCNWSRIEPGGLTATADGYWR